MQRPEVIRLIDEEFRNKRVSPSLVFQEADINKDGVIDVRELENALNKLDIKLEKLMI